MRYLKSSATTQPRRFGSPTNFEVGPRSANLRLTELSLAMVIPWKDGWPQWWLNDENEGERMREILEATADEVLPWEM